MREGDPVHGESITDDDTSSGVAVTLYKAGTASARTLKSGETLFITTVQIYCETGGDVFLTNDAKAAGKYVVQGAVDAYGGMIVNFDPPRPCIVSTGLKFFGAATNRNVCIVEGFIR